MTLPTEAGGGSPFLIFGDTTTVADLFSFTEPGSTTLLAGQARETPVIAVRTLDRAQVQRRARGDDAPQELDGAAVVFEYRADNVDDDYLTDIAIRLCATEHASILYLVGSRRLSSSARMLADRFALPVASIADEHVAATIARIVLLVAEPGVRHSEAIRKISTTISDDFGDVGTILRSIVDVTGGIAAVQSGSRLIQAIRDVRAEEGTPMLFAPLPVHGSTLPYSTIMNGRSVAVVPVPLPADLADQAMLLVAQYRGGGPLWRSIALDVLRVATPVVSAWAINDLLRNDRTRFHWSSILQQVLDRPTALDHALLVEAEQARWRLDDWHIAIHLSPLQGTSLRNADLSELDVLFDEAEIDCSALVPRPRGAACWVTADDITGLPPLRTIAEKLNEALGYFRAAHQDDPSRSVTARVPSVDLVAGVGGPHPAAAGLAASLAEAEQASVLIASPEGLPYVRLERGQAVSRISALWESDDRLHHEARELLAPLLPETALLETLAAFLNSSGSLNETARLLGIHRNTVRYRLHHVERMLATDLSDHTTRTALSVALRLIDPLEGDAEGAPPRLESSHDDTA